MSDTQYSYWSKCEGCEWEDENGSSAPLDTANCCPVCGHGDDLTTEEGWV